MTLEEFCVKLVSLNLTHTQQGLAVLWFKENESAGSGATAGEIAKVLREAGVSEPNVTRLSESLVNENYVNKKDGQLILKPVHRATTREFVESILEPAKPQADQEHGYLPKAVWDNTRPYIQKIAEEINKCYEFGCHNAASVLLRRLIETLLIECYEHLGIADKIKKADGNYKQLSAIINDAVDQSGLNLGRETKDLLHDSKMAGDRSAHNRRYLAVQADLKKLEGAVRTAVDELLHLAGLK